MFFSSWKSIRSNSKFLAIPNFLTSENWDENKNYIYLLEDAMHGIRVLATQIKATTLPALSTHSTPHAYITQLYPYPKTWEGEWPKDFIYTYFQ